MRSICLHLSWSGASRCNGWLPAALHLQPEFAASKNARELTQRIFGTDIGWLPWKKPGFELGLWRGKCGADIPDAKGVVLESHGLFTWR